MSSSLQPHGMQHTRLPCPSLSPRVCSNSCPLSWWCHPSISSLIAPSPPALKSFPASGSFPVSQIFISGGQSIGASASASFLPMNIQDWFPLGLTGLISASQGTLKSLFQYHQHSVLWCSTFFMIQCSHMYMTPGKTIFLIICTFVGKLIFAFYCTA